MPCIHEYEESDWNENMNCYQRLKKCKLSKLMCQGSDGICSRYEEAEKPKEEVKEEQVETQEAEPVETPREPEEKDLEVAQHPGEL